MKRLSKSVPILIITLSTLLNSGCHFNSTTGNGKIIAKSRQTNEYSEIELHGSMNVKLITGEEGKLRIRAEENLIGLIETIVKDNKLIIQVKAGQSFNSTKGIEITVPVEEISGVKLKGSGNIESQHTINTKEFNVELIGSGDIELSLSTEKTIAELDGSGNIVLNGKSKYFKCNLSGSGDINAFKLKASDIQANLDGSGNIKVNASRSLDAKLSGSGDIIYKGNPAKLTKNISGSGAIDKK